MSRRTRVALALVPALAVLFATAPAARADTGTITVTANTPVSRTLTEVAVSVTVNKTACDSPDNCNWFPVVSTVEPGQPCTQEHGAYLGKIVSRTGEFTQDLGRALLDVPAVRLCLWIHLGAGGERLLQSADLDLPKTTPPPEPPAPAPPGSDRLSMRDAKASVKPILRREFKSRFKQRSGFRRRCVRRSATVVRCAVRWRHDGRRYAGTLRLRLDPEDADDILYLNRVHKR